MACEVCQSIKSRLESELGNRITRRLIEDMLGITLTSVKACGVCGQGYYAKGLCYNHYMAARRGASHYVQRTHKLLCVTCGMIIIEGGAKDGKFYCSTHLANQMPMDSQELESETKSEKELKQGKD